MYKNGNIKINLGESVGLLCLISPYLQVEHPLPLALGARAGKVGQDAGEGQGEEDEPQGVRGIPRATPAVEAAQEGLAPPAPAAGAQVLEADQGQQQVVGGGHGEHGDPLRHGGVVQEASHRHGGQEQAG